MRFSAAIVDGRPVRELVEQSFSFRIAPPAAAPSEHTRTNPVP
jgi:CheY-specific phosphatase CheX